MFDSVIAWFKKDVKNVFKPGISIQIADSYPVSVSPCFGNVTRVSQRASIRFNNANHSNGAFPSTSAYQTTILVGQFSNIIEPAILLFGQPQLLFYIEHHQIKASKTRRHQTDIASQSRASTIPVRAPCIYSLLSTIVTRLARVRQ